MPNYYLLDHFISISLKVSDCHMNFAAFFNLQKAVQAIPFFFAIQTLGMVHQFEWLMGLVEVGHEV